MALSDVLVEKLSGSDDYDEYAITLISYISFMCLLVFFLTRIVYKTTKLKTKTIIVFIISLVISVLLVVLPLNYTISNVYNNVSENSDSSPYKYTIASQNHSASSNTYKDNDSEYETSHTIKLNGAYLLNPDSMKIHTCYCHTIKHKENFIKTTDYEKAISDGYEPCKVCNPENMGR